MIEIVNDILFKKLFFIFQNFRCGNLFILVFIGMVAAIPKKEQDPSLLLAVRTITEGNNKSSGVSGCKGEAVVEPRFKRGDIK